MVKIGAAQRLVSSAQEELIENHGHMEMSAVARRAGLSVGLAYHHFGSKAGLMAAVIDRFYEPIREIALGDQIPLESPWSLREYDRLSALITYYYKHPLAPLVVGRLARDPEVLDVERAHVSALLQAGARNIAQGQELGVVRMSLDPDVTVAMLMGGMQLAINQALLAPRRPAKKKLLEHVWDYIHGALGLDEERDQSGDFHHEKRRIS